MSDKYDENGEAFLREFFKNPSGVEDKLPGMVAAFGRQCAAEAYEDAAKIVYAQSRNRPASPDALAKTFIAKAFDMRRV